MVNSGICIYIYILSYSGYFDKYLVDSGQQWFAVEKYGRYQKLDDWPMFFHCDSIVARSISTKKGINLVIKRLAMSIWLIMSF